MSNIKEQLRNAKAPEKRVPICLRGDLARQYEALEQELEELASGPDTKKLGGDPERDHITAEMDALREQMADATETFLFRGLPSKRYQALKDEHPMRVDENGNVPRLDAIYNFNTVTMFEPLIRACVVEPEMDSDDWLALFGTLTDGQFDRLGLAAVEVNRKVVDVPFSRSGSRPIPS